MTEDTQMVDVTISVKNNSVLCVELSGIDCKANFMNINVIEIKNAHDEWLMSVGNHIVHDSGSIKAQIEIETDYPDMLCELTHIILTYIEDGAEDQEKQKIQLVGGKDFTNTFFKIDQNKLEVHSDFKIEAEQIRQLRTQKFLEPIGDIQSAKAHDFAIFVFLSNCFLPAGIFSLEKCQVIPHDNLGVLDIMDSVRKLLVKTKLELKLPDSDDVIKQLEGMKPTAVLYFPAIKAATPESAFNYISERLFNIVNLLSYRRLSKVDVFAYLFYNRTANRGGISIPQETYPGNLMPDFVSESNYFLNLEPIVATDIFIQFILNLYRHALAEKRPDFIYFFFWNILESIARHKGFDIEKNPDGTVKLDKKGRPVKTGAAKMVSELIDNVYPKYCRSISFSSGNKTYSLIDMTIMWCQHRNCTAHRGGCNPSYTPQCDTRNQNVVKCRSYTVNATNAEQDICLRTIKRVTREMIDDILSQ